MLERKVEDYFVLKAKELGAEVRKVAWTGRRGAPDRVVFYKGAHWVELKRPGGRPRPEQVREHQKMEAHGVRVHVIDTLQGVDEFFAWLR